MAASMRINDLMRQDATGCETMGEINKKNRKEKKKEKSKRKKRWVVIFHRE